MDSRGLYVPCLPGWNSGRLPAVSSFAFLIVTLQTVSRVRHGERHFYSRWPRVAQSEMVEDEGYALRLSHPLGSYDYICDKRWV